MKKQHLALEQQLSSVPIRNEYVKVTRTDDDASILVRVELRHPGWVGSFGKFVGMKDSRQYRLDGIGRQVYESIDGKKNFEKLIDEFGEQHKLTFFESRALLMQYIEMLMKRGLVVIGVRKDVRPGKEA